MEFPEVDETLLVVPEICCETTEYQNIIEVSNEHETEIDDEQEEPDTISPKEEVVQQFSRFERSFRSRRIRELTMPRHNNRRGYPHNKQIAA